MGFITVKLTTILGNMFPFSKPLTRKSKKKQMVDPHRLDDWFRQKLVENLKAKADNGVNSGCPVGS